MKYCQYYYNPYMVLPCYAANPEMQQMNMYRDFEDEDDDEFEAEALEVSEITIEEMRDGEEEEIFEGLTRTVQDVNRVMREINNRFGYLYRELQRYGINNNLARILFRAIVTYVDGNYNKYRGNINQRVDEAFQDLRRDQRWIFAAMRSNGVPQNRINQIIRTIIRFALLNLRGGAVPGPGPVPPPPPIEDIEQRATRIANQIRQQTNIFNRLNRFGVPAVQANSIVRTVVIFTLRNNPQPVLPGNIDRRTNELVALLEDVNPALVRQLQGYGMTLPQIRELFRDIISFTLRSQLARDDEEEGIE